MKRIELCLLPSELERASLDAQVVVQMIGQPPLEIADRR